MLYEKADNNSVRCFLCAHRCRIAESRFGICGVRQNVAGKLNTLVYGELIAANVDPVEKKPLYHFLPGSYSYSIATRGCNFRCAFCQNWQISQLSGKNSLVPTVETVYPEEIVRGARSNNCRSISYTYTEPTIFFEYAYDIALIAKKEKIYNIFVTNGYMTEETIEKAACCIDAANVDLKSFSDDYYRSTCGARLKPVLDSINLLKKAGVWVEITTLVVPNLNDSNAEFNEIASFIASVGKDIPWHLSRFHPEYKLTDKPATPLSTLGRAFEIGKKQGLRYVYLGNTEEGSATFCPNCGKLLIKRSGYYVEHNKLKDGRCYSCNTAIEGVWNNSVSKNALI